MIEPDRKPSCPAPYEIDEAQCDRKWLSGAGIISIILGFIVLGVPTVKSFVSVVFLGSVLLINGVFQIFRHSRTSTRKEFLLDFVVSAFYVSIGTIMILDPRIGTVSLSLLVALFLVVTGILRIARAAAARFRSWGWVFFNGSVSLGLGVILWAGWPLAGLWVIGLFIGLEMVLYGISILMAADAIRILIRDIRRYCRMPN